MVERLEDCCSLSQNAVRTEHRVLLLEVEDDVVGGVAGGVVHAARGALHPQHLAIAQLGERHTI